MSLLVLVAALMVIVIAATEANRIINFVDRRVAELEDRFKEKIG